MRDESRHTALNFEKAVQYHYGQFPIRELSYKNLIHPLLAATNAVARYDQMLKNMRNSEILLAPMRRQEAVISSRMEGTVSTMDEILKFEADQDEAGHRNVPARSEVIETFLYQRSLRNAQQAMDDGYPLSLSLVKGLHKQLLSFGRGAKNSPGELKREQNYLADGSRKNILFVPISPEKLQDGLDSLFRYIDSSEHPALLRTALTHAEFEALHPFKDGNGRIGRMLIPLMLWSSGTISAPHFYVSAYLEDHKDQYISALRNVSASGAWGEWCRFFLRAIERQAIRNLEIAESISGLYEEMKSRFADVLRSKWSTLALDFVFTRPVFRNSRFTGSSGIPRASAARFTRLLLEENLLEVLEEPAGRRPGLYSFEPLLELVRV